MYNCLNNIGLKRRANCSGIYFVFPTIMPRANVTVFVTSIWFHVICDIKSINTVIVHVSCVDT